VKTQKNIKGEKKRITLRAMEIRFHKNRRNRDQTNIIREGRRKK